MVGICRLCASLRKKEFLSTTITDANHDVFRKLLQCCQVKICLNNALPKSVCMDCVQSLQLVYSFYTKVQEAQESLTALFSGETSVEGQEYTMTISGSLVEALEPSIHLRNPKEDPNPHVNKLKDETKTSRNIHSEEDCTIMVREETQKAEHRQVTEVADKIECESNSTVFDLQDSTYSKAHNHEKENEQVIDKKSNADEFEETGENLKQIEYYIDQSEVDSATEYEIETNLPNDSINEDTVLSKTDEIEVEEEIMDEDHLEDTKNEELIPTELHVNEWSSYSWCCYLCSQSADTFANLQHHVQKSHKVKPTEMEYKCTDCQKVCARYHAFLNHVRFRHHTALALRCDACDKENVSYAKLAQHRRQQCTVASSHPLLLLCEKCGKAFNSHKSLQTHTRAQHSDVDKVLAKCFQCQHCDKKFKCNSALSSHQSIHCDDKQFICIVCGHAFRQKANLIMHSNSHRSDKPFNCTICNKSFKTSINLEKHALVHSDTREFKCDHCSKSFRTKDAKLSHERTHTGEMPYKCEHCGRPFRYRSTLMTHVNLHTGDRPYSCAPCNHHFTNWSNYNKHMKRRHNSGAKKTNNKNAKAKSNKSHPQLNTSSNEIVVVYENAERDSTASNVSFNSENEADDVGETIEISVMESNSQESSAMEIFELMETP